MIDLVSVQIFAPDVSLWEQFNRAYVKRFTKICRKSVYRIRALLKGARFEMMGMAIRPVVFGPFVCGR